MKDARSCNFSYNRASFLETGMPGAYPALKITTSDPNIPSPETVVALLCARRLPLSLLLMIPASLRRGLPLAPLRCSLLATLGQPLLDLSDAGFPQVSHCQQLAPAERFELAPGSDSGIGQRIGYPGMETLTPP